MRSVVHQKNCGKKLNSSSKHSFQNVCALPLRQLSRRSFSSSPLISSPHTTKRLLTSQLQSECHSRTLNSSALMLGTASRPISSKMMMPFPELRAKSTTTNMNHKNNPSRPHRERVLWPCRNFCSRGNPNPPSARDPQFYQKYVKDLVQKTDYEGYLWCQMLKAPSVKESLLSVRAFNSVLSQIETPTEEQQQQGKPDISQLKFRWWSDQLDEIFRTSTPEKNKNSPQSTNQQVLSGPSDHPVAWSLAAAVDKKNLSKMWLKRLVSAREQHARRIAAFGTLEELETYAENTQSAMLYLALESMGVRDTTADHVASHIGKAWGLVTFIRGTPYHAKRRQCYLPLDLMAKYRISQEEVYHLRDSEGLTNLIFDLANHAHNHLELARNAEHLRSALDNPAAIPAFLPSVIIQDYLDRLAKAHFNIFSDPLLQHVEKAGRGLFILPKMWWNRYKKTY